MIHQNFNPSDRCILNLLHQRRSQKDKPDQVVSQWQEVLTEIEQVWEQLGLIIVTSEGKVHFMTLQGEQLVNKYFSHYDSYSLPKSLQHWLKHKISLFVSNNKVPSSLLTLNIEQGRKRLIIRLVSDLIGEKYLLLLEEEEIPTFSVSSLKLLGLSQREAEVLFWVAKDKSNAAIAKLLSCSKGTVRKHLEHIHKKLDVQTRTAAVMIALEKLGLLKGSFVAISL